MSSLFVNFIIDPYLNKVLRNINSINPKIVSYLACHELPTGNLNNIPFLDLSFLYDEIYFEKAFKDIKPAALSEDELIKLSDGLRFFLKSTDRVAPIPSSIHFNESFYWTLCEYYKAFFIKNSQIKNVVFEATPHLPHDIVLFFISKLRGIKTLILKRTGIAGICYLNEDFRYNENFWKFDYKIDNKLKDILNSKNNNDVIDKLKDLEFAKDQIDGQWPEDINKSPKIVSFIKNFVKTKKSFRFPLQIYRIAKDLISYPYFQKLGASKKFFLSSTFSHNKTIGYIDYFLVKNRYRKFLEKLKKSDMSNLDDFNLIKDKKYIFFALHFQPEASTLPEGDFYENQFLAIKILAENLPKDYYLVIKEHPKQLFYDLRNFHFRTTFFYKKIRQLDRTFLFNSKADYNKILQHSRLVATVSGSVAWQGLLLGKPCVVFGDMWINDCKSVLMYQKFKNNIKEKIIELSNQNQNLVYSNVIFFLKSHYAYFIDTIIFSRHTRFVNNLENCILNLSRAILKRLN